MGGDWNEIRSASEKKRGRHRSAGSFRCIRQFIRDMQMKELGFLGREWTWANNREGEEFVEERLDQIFISPKWSTQHPHVVVSHIPKQTSDHCLLLLNDKPQRQQAPKRFYFDKRFLELPNFEREVEQAWNIVQHGVPMYQVCSRIKCCRVALLKLKGQHILHSSVAINKIKGRMEKMQKEGNDRNWSEWKKLQGNLGEEYRKEEVFWQQKSRIQWLKKGDQTTKFFNAHAKKKEELYRETSK